MLRIVGFPNNYPAILFRWIIFVDFDSFEFSWRDERSGATRYNVPSCIAAIARVRSRTCWHTLSAAATSCRASTSVLADMENRSLFLFRPAKVRVDGTGKIVLSIESLHKRENPWNDPSSCARASSLTHGKFISYRESSNVNSRIVRMSTFRARERF